MKNKNLIKRLVFGSIFGIIFGFMCFYGFVSSTGMPENLAKWQVWSWGNLMMWSTVANRMVLGVMVGIAGFITTFPFWNAKIPVWIRGLKIGALISLPMALGSLMGENTVVAIKGFWIIMIVGGLIGVIIDLIITKIAGEGKELID